MPVNVVTTHLGLSAKERLAQMQALLGPEWLGPVLDGQPIVLCGNFGFLPGTAPLPLVTDRLCDVASRRVEALYTFISTRPFARIDHIFHIGSLTVEPRGRYP